MNMEIFTTDHEISMFYEGEQLLRNKELWNKQSIWGRKLVNGTQEGKLLRVQKGTWQPVVFAGVVRWNVCFRKCLSDA